MQKDPKAGIDLTAEYPTPGARLAPVTETRRPDDAGIDLAATEQPSGELTVHRSVHRETSTLSVDVRIWKIIHIKCDYEVRGPVSWVVALTLVLTLAIVAALAVPSLVLPIAAASQARMAVAATAGCAVLACGAFVLLYGLRRKP